MPTPTIARLALLAAALLAAPAAAQDVICCDQLVDAGGDWIGAAHPDDCQAYLNSASLETAQRLCKQRAALACLDTSRCDELEASAEPPPAPEAPSGAASLPPPDAAVQDGLEQGFGVSPPAADAVPAPRPVYLSWPPEKAGGFEAKLDPAACLVPLAVAADAGASGAVKHEVSGRVERGVGSVRVELRVRDAARGTSFGPVKGEAEGEDAAAIAVATRKALRRLGLLCRR